MYKTISSSDFHDAFTSSHYYSKHFSYEARQALFEYLENYESETDTRIELDIIALACEYAEYPNAMAAVHDHLDQDALVYLQDRTEVIQFDSGIIIRSF